MAYKISLVLIGALVFTQAVVAETLFGNYFDIQTGSTSGAEVTGKIHLLSNKDAHQAPVPGSYTFELVSDPSGIFALSDEHDTVGRLFGVLKVDAGKTISASPVDYPLTIALKNGGSTVISTSIVVHAVDTLLLDTFSTYAEEFCGDERLMSGRRTYGNTEVENLLDEIEANSGAFTSEWYYAAGGYSTNFPFYTQDILSYITGPGAGTKTPLLKMEWDEVMRRIGGLGEVYYKSSTYGPGGDPVKRERLKQGIYSALAAFLPRIPVDPADVIYLGQPIGTEYGDGMVGLANGEPLHILHYNNITHIWEPYQSVVGPMVWIMPELLQEVRTGDADAIALHEEIIRFLQLQFTNSHEQQEISGNSKRSKNLIATNHTEGAFSDANLGHRIRTWLCMPAIWGDYNRPITYVPYWYDGFYDSEASGFQYKPGWSPNGVVEDLRFWLNHFHPDTHFFVQSGFQPDGTVTHHLPDSSDVAMFSYGYDWLITAVDGMELYRDTGLVIDDSVYQFVTDRFLYTYDRMVYKGCLDYVVAGRGYVANLRAKFGEREMVNDPVRLVAAKQPGTVISISNEAALLQLSSDIDNGTHDQSGNTPFWVANYMVHRRGGGGEAPFYQSVKIENDRTNGAEDFESTKKSWHAGSGILQTLVRGDEYELDVRYNMDWHALPGLTEEWRTDELFYVQTSQMGGSPYSGLASDGRYGFAAMEYRSLSGTYSVARADKAFFFTEKEAIALGNSVDRLYAGQGNDIITTVDQARWVDNITYSINGAAPVTLSTGTNPNLSLTPNAVTWLHQGDVGYVVFPESGQPLTIRGGSSVPPTDPSKAAGDPTDLFHIALGHGASPSSGGWQSYHYVMVPNVTAAQMPAYVADLTNRVEIVANGGGVQGIRDTSLELVQLAFYGAGSATLSTGKTISVDRSAMVQLREVGENWQLCVTDPQHAYAATEINLQISEALTPGIYDYDLPGIYPRAGESMEVTASGGGVDVKVLLPDSSNDATYNYQAELYAGAPILMSIPASAPTAVITVVSDDLQSNSWSGGAGWSGDWAVTTGSGQPELDLLAGNYCVKLTRGDLNHSITRTLAAPVSGGTLLFKWDVDSLDNPAEYAYAEVFDGTWHTVWSMNSSGNGSDLKPTPDNLQEASVDLSAYGAVTQIRFSMSNTTSSGDYFYLDDIELCMTWYAAYQDWTIDYALSGEDAALLANPDGDGLDNLGEYALGGYPDLAGLPAGILPELYVGSSGGGDVMIMLYRRRLDAAARGLYYYLDLTENLDGGPWSTNGYTETGTQVLDAEFECVTNEIPIGVSNGFIRLNIETD